MKTPNFSNCSSQDVKDFAKTCSHEQILAHAHQMSSSQIQTFIETIFSDGIKDNQNKLKTLMFAINSRQQLETIGSYLDIHQLLFVILPLKNSNDGHDWKLSPLIVGIHHTTFSTLLEKASPNHLQILKDECVTEPVQHQLTTLKHQLNNDIKTFETTIEHFYEKIESFDIKTLSLLDVQDFIQEIELLRYLFDKVYHKSNKALAIAWNTNRLDLIEAFDKFKDDCRKYMHLGLGYPLTEDEKATGLYSFLDDKLFAVYGNCNEKNSQEAVLDTEPVQEGLVKLNIWYLKDYESIGLLNCVHDQKDLELEIKHCSKNEKVQLRENLFKDVQKNLLAIGLSTVKDLKKNHIFSKKSLLEYIQQKKTLSNKR